MEPELLVISMDKHQIILILYLMPKIAIKILKKIKGYKYENMERK